MVNFGRYRVVGDNIFIHSLKIILTPKTISWSNKLKDIFYLNTEFQPFNIVLSSMFIDLFGSLFENDTLVDVDKIPLELLHSY